MKLKFTNSDEDQRPICEFGSHRVESVTMLRLPFARTKTACPECVVRHQTATANFDALRERYKGTTLRDTHVLRKLDAAFEVAKGPKVNRQIDIETVQGTIKCSVVRSISGYVGCAEYKGHPYTAFSKVPSHVVTKIVERLKVELQIA